MDNNVNLKVEELKQKGYDFQVGSIFNKAWELFSGIAVYAILAVIIYCIVAWVMSFVGGLIYAVPVSAMSNVDDVEAVYVEMFSSPLFLLSNLLSIVVTAATAPILFSIVSMAKKFDNHQTVGVNDIFAHYSDGKFMNIFLTYLAIQILGMIGMVLCVIPGIIVYIATVLAIPFVLFSNATAVEAIKASKDVVFKNFGSIFVYCLACLGIIIIGALACGVGLLAAIPLTYISLYVLYKVIIGEDEHNEIEEIGTDIYKDNPYMK